jgi:hypothetical protein
MSARTCIICGGPTGSREHIFPAALGGRRTNKGIYCGDHNEAYSGLAGIITEQLAFFNAQLGVVGDHADKPTSVTMTDVASGQEIEMRDGQVRFKSPQTRSEKTADGQTVTEMAFSNQKEAEDWVREQKAKGVDVKIISMGSKARYHPGTGHKQIKLGGDEEGLRAIGYIAQTFLAHAFPDIARLPALQGIKDYTLNNVGTGFVWWDFEPPANLPPNAFPFGHRVIVGLNGEDGTAYARISFFSTLNFAILLGTVPLVTSRTVITDIDPLAQSPPNDIVTLTEDAAVGAVRRPDVLSASLAEAIRSGQAESQVRELMRRITDFKRQAIAASIMARIAGAAALPDAERNALFDNIVSTEAQRVLNLMCHVANDLKERASNPVENAMATFMEQATALDPAAENGLSEEATRSLAVACEALAKQMSEDCKAGRLDQDRMEMLIGGGPGAAVVGTALAEKFALRFPDR